MNKIVSEKVLKKHEIFNVQKITHQVLYNEIVKNENIKFQKNYLDKLNDKK